MTPHAVAAVRAWPARRKVGLGLIAFVPLAWFGALHAIRVNDLMEHAAPTTATVLEVHQEAGDRVKDHIRVEFRTADGRVVRNDMTRYWWQHPVVGETVPIEYAVRDGDAYAQQAGFRPFDTDVWGGLIIAVTLSAAGPALVAWSLVQPELPQRASTRVVEPDWVPDESLWTHRTGGDPPAPGNTPR